MVKKFDSQLKEISLATGSQFGAQTTSVAFLGESLDYLLKVYVTVCVCVCVFVLNLQLSCRSYLRTRIFLKTSQS